jgi:hypothetical protein
VSTVDIRVTTPGGTSAIVAGDKFTYVPGPTVTRISPAIGSTAGRTVVTITGTGFTSASTVMFGTKAASVRYNSATSLTATSPAGTGIVDIRVTTLGGTSPITQPADQFTYTPTVTRISPTNGPAAGRTVVTITGTGFTSASTVKFGTKAASVKYNSATSLTATSPSGTGTVDVRVTTVAGTSAIVAGDKFTYLPAPKVTRISPANGPVAGGTAVTITGTGFTSTSTVTFGTKAASVRYNSATRLTATSPAGTGTVDVRVTTVAGTSAIVAGDKFTYYEMPTITSISPASGPLAGRTVVTITGTGFTSASTVKFGTKTASVRYNSATRLTATSPAGAGTVDVRVTTPRGTSAIVAGDKFTYLPAPKVTRISPASGPAAGGTAVMITGTGFTSASTVKFGTKAASARYNSATSLTATSPAGTGTVDIRVTTPGGTSAIVTGDKFIYVPAELPSTHKISGYVYDGSFPYGTKKGISGALVTYGNVNTVSDTTGFFSFSIMSGPDPELTISAPGFHNYKETPSRMVNGGFHLIPDSVYRGVYLVVWDPQEHNPQNFLREWNKQTLFVIVQKGASTEQVNNLTTILKTDKYRNMTGGRFSSAAPPMIADEKPAGSDREGKTVISFSPGIESGGIAHSESFDGSGVINYAEITWDTGQQIEPTFVWHEMVHTVTSGGHINEWPSVVSELDANGNITSTDEKIFNCIYNSPPRRSN